MRVVWVGTDVIAVYWERQVAGLCGQHCVNTLLQGPYLSPDMLSEVALRLDAQERAAMAVSAFGASGWATSRINSYMCGAGNWNRND